MIKRCQRLSKHVYIRAVDRCGDIAQQVGACEESASSAFGRLRPSAAGDTDGRSGHGLCSHSSGRRGRAGATDPRSSGRQRRGHRTQPKTAQSSAPPPPKHPHPTAAGAQGAQGTGRREPRPPRPHGRHSRHRRRPSHL